MKIEISFIIHDISICFYIFKLGHTYMMISVLYDIIVLRLWIMNDDCKDDIFQRQWHRRVFSDIVATVWLDFQWLRVFPSFMMFYSSANVTAEFWRFGPSPFSEALKNLSFRFSWWRWPNFSLCLTCLGCSKHQQTVPWHMWLQHLSGSCSASEGTRSDAGSATTSCLNLVTKGIVAGFSADVMLYFLLTCLIELFERCQFTHVISEILGVSLNSKITIWKERTKLELSLIQTPNQWGFEWNCHDLTIESGDRSHQNWRKKRIQIDTNSLLLRLVVDSIFVFMNSKPHESTKQMNWWRYERQHVFREMLIAGILHKLKGLDSKLFESAWESTCLGQFRHSKPAGDSARGVVSRSEIPGWAEHCHDVFSK